ncbi:MAG: hypothetical protein L3J36_10705 [Rhodobacteraceae bacterium]|nr:hypothetical protein [Paracoccaceae bacterium]
MRLTWNETHVRAAVFAQDEANAHSEKGDPNLLQHVLLLKILAAKFTLLQENIFSVPFKGFFQNPKPFCHSFPNRRAMKVLKELVTFK